ncbi:hypothetical protein KCP70_19380 [Salmonella enterica subsp. enterica]|nr:hypothetical protein KCP70_19380 [Salmonella enterica subsp. enterica]
MLTGFCVGSGYLRPVQKFAPRSASERRMHGRRPLLPPRRPRRSGKSSIVFVAFTVRKLASKQRYQQIPDDGGELRLYPASGG